MSIGENIEQKRKDKGMTQSDLANKVGVTPSMINQLEHDVKKTSLQVGALIAEALECSLDDLTQRRKEHE